MLERFGWLWKPKVKEAPKKVEQKKPPHCLDETQIKTILEGLNLELDKPTSLWLTFDSTAQPEELQNLKEISQMLYVQMLWTFTTLLETSLAAKQWHQGIKKYEIIVELGVDTAELIKKLSKLTLKGLSTRY